MLRSNNSSSSSTTYHPSFTQSQWQELEHQALIYKYMASGIPIPSDLLLPIRRSFFLNPITSPSSLSPYLIPQPPSLGWSCFGMGGYGRKAEDPEPGRCRRTDGKKWRCSKEAYPDSKYCERHMHRGKNRSRKPVEISLNTNTTATTTPTVTMATNDVSNYPYQLHYPHHPYNAVADNNRYSFLSDGANNGRGGNSWELRPLGLGEPKQDEEEKKHCFVLGADFKLGKSEREEEEESRRPLRRFFDEWPQMEGESSKTQLSISIPMGLHDFQH